MGEDVPADEKQAGLKEGEGVSAGGYTTGGLSRGIELHACIPSEAGCKRAAEVVRCSHLYVTGGDDVVCTAGERRGRCVSRLGGSYSQSTGQCQETGRNSQSMFQHIIAILTS